MHVGEEILGDAELGRRALMLRSDPETDFPVLTAKFKLTWRCNLRCSLCRLWRRPHQYGRPRDLPLDTVVAALESLKERGLRKVHFSGGEALLVPHFREVVTAARELGLQVNLTTNGTLLDKEWARFLVDSRVHAVTVSIDSPDHKEHDAMRGVAGAWKKSWRGIERLAERRRKKGRGPAIGVNTIMTRKNIDGLGELHRMIMEHGADRWRLLPVDTDDKKARPTAEQWRELAERWQSWREVMSRLPLDWSSGMSAEKAGKGKYSGRFYKDRVCFAPWFNVFVDADGKTYPCCMGKANMTPYGNLLDSAMPALLESGARRETLCTMASGHVYPVCEKCDDFLEENLAFHKLYNRRERDED